MELGKIIKARAAFLRHADEKLSPALSWKIFRFVKTASENELIFYEKRMRALIDKYARRGEDGKPILDNAGNLKITEDKRGEFLKEVDELDGVQVEAPAFKFSVSELGEIKLSVSDISALYDLIEEGDKNGIY